MRGLIFLFCVVCTIEASSAPVPLHLLADESAKCLDGTPGGFYFEKGTVNKFVIFLQGGGEHCHASFSRLFLSLFFSLS